VEKKRRAQNKGRKLPRDGGHNSNKDTKRLKETRGSTLKGRQGPDASHQTARGTSKEIVRDFRSLA